MSLLNQFLLRIVLMVAAIGIAAVLILWLFRWNMETQRSSMLSALIAGAFVGLALLFYRVLVHPIAVQIDAQWKNRSARLDG